MVIGNDDRQVTNAVNAFPLSAVTAVDMFYPNIGNFIGSGIVIAPNHVLTAAHNAYDTTQNVATNIIRATTSTNLNGANGLNSRTIGTFGDPVNNVTNVNFLKNYNTTESFNDDIALFTTNNTLLPSSSVVGLIAFVDPSESRGYAVNTAGYPGDNVSSNIPGNSGISGRDLVIGTGSLG